MSIVYSSSAQYTLCHINSSFQNSRSPSKYTRNTSRFSIDKTWSICALILTIWHFFQAFNSHILSMNYKVFAKVNKFYKVLKWIIMMHDDKYAWILNTWNILKMIEKVRRLVKLVQTCNNLYSLTREKSEHKEITIDTEKNGKLLVW